MWPVHLLWNQSVFNDFTGHNNAQIRHHDLVQSEARLSPGVFWLAADTMRQLAIVYINVCVFVLTARNKMYISCTAPDVTFFTLTILYALFIGEILLLIYVLFITPLHKGFPLFLQGGSISSNIAYCFWNNVKSEINTDYF